MGSRGGVADPRGHPGTRLAGTCRLPQPRGRRGRSTWEGRAGALRSRSGRRPSPPRHTLTGQPTGKGLARRPLASWPRATRWGFAERSAGPCAAGAEENLVTQWGAPALLSRCPEAQGACGQGWCRPRSDPSPGEGFQPPVSALLYAPDPQHGLLGVELGTQGWNQGGWPAPLHPCCEAWPVPKGPRLQGRRHCLIRDSLGGWDECVDGTWNRVWRKARAPCVLAWSQPHGSRDAHV